jgi:hypothetical protein
MNTDMDMDRDRIRDTDKNTGRDTDIDTGMDMSIRSVMAMTLRYIASLLNISLLWRDVIASESYRSANIKIIIASDSYCFNYMGGFISFVGYFSGNTKNRHCF